MGRFWSVDLRSDAIGNLLDVSTGSIVMAIFEVVGVRVLKLLLAEVMMKLVVFIAPCHLRNLLA